MIHHLLPTFAPTVPVDQLVLAPYGPGLFCWGENGRLAQLNAMAYLCASGVPVDSVRLHPIQIPALVHVTQSLAAFSVPEMIIGLPDELMVAAIRGRPVPHHEIDRRLGARHTIQRRLEEGHQMLAAANGYRVHGPGEAHEGVKLQGKYWWTLYRDGWSGVETSPGEFSIRDDALNDAVRAHLEEARESQPQQT